MICPTCGQTVKSEHKPDPKCPPHSFSLAWTNVIDGKRMSEVYLCRLCHLRDERAVDQTPKPKGPRVKLTSGERLGQ